MDKIVKRLLMYLRIEFYAVWLIAVITYLLGEFDVIPNGELVTTPGSPVEVNLNIANILAVFICVPLSVKLFSLNTRRSLRRMNKDEALGSYHFWSCMRLCLLLVCVELGIVSYFLLMNTTGLLCAAIALVMTLPCIPSEEKIKDFLDAYEGESSVNV